MIKTCVVGNKVGLTIISWKTIRRGIEELSNNLSGSLSTQTRAVRIMIHEGHLLRWLIRGLKIGLVENEVEARNETLNSSLELYELLRILGEILK